MGLDDDDHSNLEAEILLISVTTTFHPPANFSRNTTFEIRQLSLIKMSITPFSLMFSTFSLVFSGNVFIDVEEKYGLSLLGINTAIEDSR